MGRFFGSSMAKMGICAAAIGMAALTLQPVAAGGQAALTVAGGQTTLVFQRGFLAQVSSAGMTVAGAQYAQLLSGSLGLPVASGVISVATSSVEILHGGGIVLTQGTNTVTLESFTYEALNGNQAITALMLVNGVLAGRVKLFDFQGAPIQTDMAMSDAGVLHLPVLELTLDQEAAFALNLAFQSKRMFSSGMAIGTWSTVVLLPLQATGSAPVPVL